MSATLSAGVNSLILKLDQPYDTIRQSDPRDDLVKVKVWCSATSGFTPSDSNKVFDALSLSITIPKLADGTPLVAGTPYYVKYAFISEIEESVFTTSAQLTATPIAATSQIVDISGFTSFVKSDETTFTPTNATLTAVIAGITNPVYAWTITGATPTTGTSASITITPNPANGTGVGVTLSVTGTGLTTPIVKTITIPITYVPPTYYISNYGAVFRRDLDGVVYPAAGIVLDSGYSKFRSSPQPTFVWKKDNVTISGATSYSYTVPASDYTSSTSHVYTSIVTGTDLGGNISSLPASVQIPRIDDGPIGPATPSFTISNYGAVFRRDIEGTVYPSAGIRLETATAAFKSTPIVTYQWKKDDVVISGATSNSYTVPVTDYATATTHNYSCTVSGQSTTGVATTLTASVTLPRVDDGPIGPATPSFTISNYGAVFRKDNTNTLYPTTGILLQTTTLGFKSSPTVTYQWKKNGTDISGAISDSYTVPVGDYATVSTNNYSCTATGQTTAGVATVLTATVTLPVITDGTVGSRGSRTATGYIYYQTAVAMAPLTPSASNYNFSTGQFDTLTAGWDYSPISPSTSDTTLKAWVSRYSVVEPTYDTATGAATITAPSASINFNGIVTFSNYSSGATPLATAASVTSKLSAADLGSSGTTVIDGGRITTGTIAAGRLDLSGVLTATSVSNTGSTTIDGGRIGTGTITANRLDLSGVLKVGSTNADGSVNTTTTINGGSIQTGSITADRLNASYIQVGTAAADVNNGVTGISAGKITTGTIDAARLNLSGYLQVGNAANDINNGTTGINGGKITTGTIDAARINLTGYLQVGGAAGDINSGTTGISGSKITTGTIDAARLNLSGYLQVGGAAGDINSSGVDVNGNRISTGINGGNITTGSITANRLSIGQTTGTDRIRLYDNKIEIWASGVRRVVLGDLS